MKKLLLSFFLLNSLWGSDSPTAKRPPCASGLRSVGVQDVFLPADIESFKDRLRRGVTDGEALSLLDKLQSRLTPDDLESFLVELFYINKQISPLMLTPYTNRFPRHFPEGLYAHIFKSDQRAVKEILVDVLRAIGEGSEVHFLFENLNQFEPEVQLAILERVEFQKIDLKPLESIWQTSSSMKLRLAAAKGMQLLEVFPSPKELLTLYSETEIISEREILAELLRGTSFFREMPFEQLVAYVKASNEELTRSALEEVARRRSPEAQAFLLKTYELGEFYRFGGQIRRHLLEDFSDFRSHPMYSSQHVFDVGVFSKAEGIPHYEFQKTGGRTLLLGGALTGKVLARIIPSKSGELWQSLLKSKEAWRKAGYEDVPLERIYTIDELVTRYSLNDKQKQDLIHLEEKESHSSQKLFYSAVEDGLNYERYKKIALPDAVEARRLEREYNEISKVVFSLGVNHGHIHEKNFVVVRKKDGLRHLILIDFDEAKVRK